MKLFEVTNGSVGESYVKVFVIAIHESTAIELAIDQYKKEYGSNERGWSDLQVEIICEDTSELWASEVRDY